jgi:carboxypeptidase C (cathepsin A)
MYPEYKKRNVYLSGESYAGKYLPLFATDILLYNSN